MAQNHLSDPTSEHALTATGGRHHVTVLFSDFSSSSRLANSVEPEINLYILEKVVDTAMAVIRRHGGVVNQCHGDGVLAVFGFPRVQEDDVRRAAEAAIELHEKVRSLSFADLELPAWFAPSMHSGIDSGLVIVGGGDWIQGQYKVTGPAANTAAALSQAANNDEIIASAAALRGVLPFFSTAEAAPMSLKGRGERTPVYRVLGRAAVDTRYEARALRGLTAFFGRQEELRSLQQALAAAGRGRLQVVTVVGTAGLGKTRLIEEFLRRNPPGGAVCRGFCESYGDIAPLQPFLQMLRRILDLSRNLSAEDTRRALGGRLAALGNGLSRYEKEYLRMLGLQPEQAGGVSQQVDAPMVAAVSALLGTIAAQGVLLLIIDDWQWADDASRQLLQGLVTQMRERPVLVLLATRRIDSLDPTTGGSTVLQLPALNPLESNRTIRALLPNCTDAEAAKIRLKSGGNALFIEELCGASTRWVPEAAEANGALIPSWLYGLVAERLQQLPPEQATLVRAVSVIGNVIPAWLLETICGVSEQDEIIHRLAGADIIAAGEARGMLRFKHGLTRDAVYALVGHAEKRDLHLRIARAIKRRYGAARRPAFHAALAHHYYGGGDFARAFCHAKRAGQRAMAASSLDSAREHYMTALNALDRLGSTPRMYRRWTGVALKWALPCIYGPAPEQLAVLQRAVDYAGQLGDADGLAHAHYFLGYINYVLGDQAQAIAHCRQALQLADQLDSPRLAAQVHATLGQSYAAASRYPPALLHLDRGIAAKRGRGTTTSVPVGSVYTMVCKAVALADMGRFAQAYDCAGWALGTVEGTGHEIESSTLNMRGAVLLWQGRWEDALEGARRSREIAARVYAPYPLAMAQALEAYAGWMLDADESRIASLQQVCRWLEERKQRLYISFAYAWLADALVAAGDPRQALVYSRLALQRAGEQDRVGEAMAYRALAAIAAATTGLVELDAEAYFGLALKSAQERESPHETAVSRLHRARHCLASGRREEANGLLVLAAGAFEEMGMDWHQARARELSASL